MADIPMINNLKDKLIPVLNRDTDDEGIEDDSAELNSTQNDVLEQFRIAPYTELDEDMLTPSKLEKVQFNVSTPRGFSFKQVEAYHTSVTKSIRRYINMLEQRDKDVHKLATEVDKYMTDVQNVRFQLEILQASGQAMVNDEGQYVKESELSPDQLRVIELENQLETARADLIFSRKNVATLTDENEDLKRQLANRPNATAIPAPVAAPAMPGAGASSAELAELAELRERQVELDAWEAEVVKEYNRMEGEYNKAVADVEALKEKLAVAEANASSLSANTADASEVARLTEELEAAITSRDEYEQAYNQYEELYKTLETAYNELEAAYKAMEEAYTTLSEQAPQQASELEALRETVGTLEAQVESLREELAEKEYAGPTQRIPGYKLPDGVTPEDLGLV